MKEVYKKYNKIYRVIALLLILVTLSGLAGCKGDGGSSFSDGGTNSSDSSGDAIPDAENSDGSPTAGTGNDGTSSGTSEKPNISPSATAIQNATSGGNSSTPSNPTSTSAPSGSTSTAKPENENKIVFEKMPVVKIETENKASITSTSVYVNCSISSDRCPEECSFKDSAAAIKVRGNSTATAAKKPYRIKFNTKQAMFGLNDGAKCKSWCLMADYFDHSMLRNYTAFNLGRTLLGDQYFCSDSMHVEVYINGSYEGVYLLCEQSQVNKKRVNIYEKQENETNLQVGYLMIGQGGRTDEEDSVVITVDGNITDLTGTVMGLGGMNFSLSGGPYTDAQKAYIEKFASNALKIVWRAIYEKKYYSLDANGNIVQKTSFNGTSTEQKQRETIGAVMNIDSAVRMYILDEIVKNFDAGTFNMYMDLSPTGDKKITFGPPWDFDFAMGNSKYSSTLSPLDVYAANFTYSDGYRTNFLFVMLYSLNWFREDVSKVWRENYNALMADIEEIKTVVSFGKAEFASNYRRWPTLGIPTMGHQADHVYSFRTQADAADYLYDWLISRMKYIDSQWRTGVFKNQEAVESEMSDLDFSKSDTLNFISKYRRCTGTPQSDSLKLTVTDSLDPYFYVDYTKSSSKINAGLNKTMSITYMAPKSNSASSYTCEVFLVSGSANDAEAGKSVLFDFTADGKYHTKVIDLSSVPFWNGNVNGVRIDFFCESSNGDVFYMKELKISK